MQLLARSTQTASVNNMVIVDSLVAIHQMLDILIAPDIIQPLA